MLANSLADVVAEEAAKRLLPDADLERKAKKTERIGVCVAKRLSLVQADIWAKHCEAGVIYELDPLLEVEGAVHKVCCRKVGGRIGSLRPFARSSYQLLEMQSLQRAPCRQTVQFLEQNTLRPSAMCGRRHLPFQKQEKDSTFTRPQNFVCAANPVFPVLPPV